MESYRIFRSINGQSFEQVVEGTALPYVDVNLRPQINRYCYYVVYGNSCGRESAPSETACAIKLDGINQQNKRISLNWSPYGGWESGVQDYLLEIRDGQGALVGPPISLGSTAMNYQDPIDPNRQISQYRIVAISNDSIPLRSYSNVIIEDIPLQIYVPNSFTPNNDGLNDTFTAKGLFIDEYSMEIYSRWGELLFHTTDLEAGWDGIYRGSLSPEDTYVFKIEASDPNGRSMIKSGTVHLLRKDN
jgi:gliding motility-associated-like protein